jgi:protocatechuate 3,4-dioxygenase beta subunit
VFVDEIGGGNIHTLSHFSHSDTIVCTLSYCNAWFSAAEYKSPTRDLVQKTLVTPINRSKIAPQKTQHSKLSKVSSQMFTALVPPCWLARAKKRSLLLTSTLLLLVLYSAGGRAQTPSKAPSASISGRVTIDGKGVGGITVTATASSSSWEKRTAAKTTTDDDGKYQLTGLPAGQFTIMPLAKAFVLGPSDAHQQPVQSITVADGETITKIDFALIREGVITGRITDTDGHPVIGERVNVVARDTPDTGQPMTMLDGPRNKTDDRGIYRVYGLSPGNYKVSIGQTAGVANVAIMGMGGSQYAKTFYPGVAEEAKATILEINEGTEVSNIDIMARKSGRGFSVSGRVVDADSGQPVPNVFVVHSSVRQAKLSVSDWVQVPME